MRQRLLAWTLALLRMAIMGVENLDEIAVRFLIDLLAVVALVVALRGPWAGRPGDRPRTDLIGSMLILNVCLHFVTLAVTRTDFGLGAGFGLFALLSIVRLRSRVFTTSAVAYLFAVLSIALVTGVEGIAIGLAAAGSVLIVLTVGTVVALGARHRIESFEVVVDAVLVSTEEMSRELARMGFDPISAGIVEVDAVRELTRVRVSVRG